MKKNSLITFWQHFETAALVRAAVARVIRPRTALPIESRRETTATPSSFLPWLALWLLLGDSCPIL